MKEEQKWGINNNAHTCTSHEATENHLSFLINLSKNVDNMT